MPDEHLIRNISELDRELRELETQILTAYVQGKKTRKKDVEKSRKEIEDLKKRKDELQKEKSRLQEVVQLQGSVETREKRITEFKKQIKMYRSKIKELEKIKNEEIERLKEEIAELQQKISDLKSEIQELNEKIKKRNICMLQLENEMKENESNHKNRIKEIAAKHEEEIKDLRYKMTADIRKQQENHSRELDEVHKSNDFLEDEVKNLKATIADNYKYRNQSSEETKHILYLGQVFSELQTNWYRYVIPKRYHDEHRAYKVKNIKDDIEDSELLTEEEQADAKRKWKELQNKIEWKKKESSIGAIKRLQDKRNLVAHPKNLSEEGAMSAATALRDQGKLNVKPSFAHVETLIKLWVSSRSLPEL